jgi:hypothetical protein
MTFAELKQHSIVSMKELPIAVRFCADLMFKEPEQLLADRLLCINMGLKPAGKKSQRRGCFSAVWRTMYADCAGYNSFMARLTANLPKRSWADI